MTSIDQLEAKKKALQLEREIAWMEREKKGVAALYFLTSKWLTVPLGGAGLFFLTSPWTLQAKEPAFWLGAFLFVSAAVLKGIRMKA